MPKNKLSESIDHFGIPLSEGVEVEVSFKHHGKDAVAVFDMSGGYLDRSRSREFPPEHEEPDMDRLGIYFKETDQEIDPSEVDLTELESQAIEKYFDQYYEG